MCNGVQYSYIKPQNQIGSTLCGYAYVDTIFKLYDGYHQDLQFDINAEFKIIGDGYQITIPAISNSAYWPTHHPLDSVEHYVDLTLPGRAMTYTWRENGQLWVEIAVDHGDSIHACGGGAILTDTEYYNDIEFFDQNGNPLCETLRFDEIFRVAPENGSFLFDINQEFILYSFSQSHVTIPAGPDYVPTGADDPCSDCDCPVCQECPETNTAYDNGYDAGYQAGLAAAAECEGTYTYDDVLQAQIGRAHV